MGRAMFDQHWCLDENGVPYQEPDLLKWASWMEKADRHIGDTRLGPFRVSTVFLGMDHGWSSPVPILYETMVFSDQRSVEGHSDLDMRRYATRSEAILGHKEIVKQVEELIAKTNRSIEGNTKAKHM